MLYREHSSHPAVLMGRKGDCWEEWSGETQKMASEQRTEPRDCIYDTGSIWYSSAVKGRQGKAATGSACYSGQG